MEDFLDTYASIRTLQGVGDYTAAAVVSICFNLPHAVVDGNVLRVVSRLTNDAGDIRSSVTRRRVQDRAQQLLDRRFPGKFNQALMELGATLCTPRRPRCSECPIAAFCQARVFGTAEQLPVELRQTPARRIEKSILIIERDRKILVRQTARGRLHARRLLGAA